MTLRTSLAAALLCLAGAANAQWATDPWKVSYLSVPDTCTSCNDDRQAAFDLQQARIARTTPWVIDEADTVSAWMQAAGLPPPLLPEGKILKIIDAKTFPSKKLQENWQGTAGLYSVDRGLYLSYESFVETVQPDGNVYLYSREIGNADTVAHEVFHAVQEGFGYAHPESIDHLWHTEGTPSGVAYLWTSQSYGVQVYRPQDYSQPLHKPADPYTRGGFFQNMARDLVPTDPVRMFATLYAKTPEDGHGGLDWLDRYLEPTHGGLSGYFPRFIAHHATLPDTFATTSAKAALRAAVTGPGAFANGLRTDTVAEVAANYHAPQVAFEGRWDTVPDADRVYVSVLSIPDAERIDDLRLIPGPRVLPGDARDLSVRYATAGTVSHGAVRVSNVAARAIDSGPQTYTLRLETAPVRFSVDNSCVTAGQTVQINVDGPISRDEATALFGAGPHALRPSVGSIGADLSYVVPASATGTVNFDLSLPAPDGQERTVTVATLRATPLGCMLRLSMEGAVLTQDVLHNYTEFLDTGSGTAAYVRPDDIALFEGGWMDIPAQAKAMMMGAINSKMQRGTVAQIAGRTKVVDEFALHRMPFIFSRRFSWDNLRDARRADGSPTVRTPIPCPDGATGCFAIDFAMDGNAERAIVNSAGDPLEVTLAGTTAMRFEYGAFVLRRPPGW